MKNLYHYDCKTGEYTNITVADIDAMDKSIVIMSFSTPIAPPTVGTNQRAVFRTLTGDIPSHYSNGKWSVVDDFRGETYWMPNGETGTITTLGEKFPVGGLRHAPLDSIKRSKWESIKLDRDKAEYGNFEWNGHVFDGDFKSQQRILLAILASSSISNLSLEWRLANNELITLSASDIKEIGFAMALHIEDVFSHANSLKTLIESATTKEELDDILW